MIVVDASVALSGALDLHAPPLAIAAIDHAAAHGGFVPGNFVTEVIHALLNAGRRRRITDATASLALDHVLSLALKVESPQPQTILTLARAHSLTAYDAAYLALAVERNLPLATIDTPLAAAARAERCAWEPA